MFSINLGNNISLVFSLYGGNIYVSNLTFSEIQYNSEGKASGIFIPTSKKIFIHDYWYNLSIEIKRKLYRLICSHTSYYDGFFLKVPIIDSTPFGTTKEILFTGTIEFNFSVGFNALINGIVGNNDATVGLYDYVSFCFENIKRNIYPKQYGISQLICSIPPIL